MTAVLVYFAVQRVQNQDFSINADEMLIIAALGLGFNLV